MIFYHKNQRLKYILESIELYRSVSTKLLSKYLNVSERTIRRDLKELEGIGRVKSTYGGAVAIEHIGKKIYDNVTFIQCENIKNTIDLSIKIGNKVDLNSNGIEKKVFILGSFNTDLVYRVNKFVASGQTIQATDSYYSPGGKGSNQAIACVMAQGQTIFSVKLGDDEFAKKAIDFLKGVPFYKIIYFEGKNCQTGSAVVMVSEEDCNNSIIISPGANQLITSEEIKSCFEDILNSNVFLTQMENNDSAIYESLRFAHENGIKTILNPAPYRLFVEELLQFTDILTPNLSEAESIVGYKLNTTEDIKNAAELIHSKGVKNVLITLGENGCWYFDGQTHKLFPSFSAVNNDTSGAGDAFNGALAARVSSGDKLETSIIYANAFASLSVEREGASNMPSHKLTLERIKDSSLGNKKV